MEKIISYFCKIELPLARFSIFLVYFWFGFIKLLGLSPAAPLVHSLFDKTISFMPFSVFYALFSGFEVAIGIIFLIKGLERLGIVLIGLHLVTTVMPLFFLPEITWQAFMVPTLEGQYIIKNILIVLAAVVVGAKLDNKQINA